MPGQPNCPQTIPAPVPSVCPDIADQPSEQRHSDDDSPHAFLLRCFGQGPPSHAGLMWVPEGIGWAGGREMTAAETSTTSRWRTGCVAGTVRRTPSGLRSGATRMTASLRAVLACFLLLAARG